VFKKAIQNGLLGFAFCGLVGSALAQSYPNKTITIVVPFPPGGTTDVLARAVANKLGSALGQSVIVDNKPGAGATLGAGLVAKASPDGYTLFMGAVHHTIAPAVYKTLPYSFEKDFAPITTVALVPNVMVVSETSPYKTVRDVIAAAKAKPDSLSYGSNGNGTAQHMIGTQFQMLTDTQILHVPYKGSAPLATDLLGGQVTMSFDTITPVLPFIREKKLRPLAVTTAKRSSTLPSVPTMKESGVNMDVGTWFGLLAPAATPKDITAKLNTEIVKIIKSAEFQKQMFDIGAEPVGNTQAQMAKQIADETVKFSSLAKAAKLSIE
jgi:tripartite-type tricarboxylate transporter receptor subunit TctC